MTLDEAIAHYKEVAEENEYIFTLCGYPTYMCDGTKDCACLKNGKNKGCLKCAKEHKQLVEWLEELKKFRKMKENIKSLNVTNIDMELIWTQKNI